MLHYVVPYVFIPSPFPPLSLSHLFSWLHLLLRSFLSSFGGDLQWWDWQNSTLGLQSQLLGFANPLTKGSCMCWSTCFSLAEPHRAGRAKCPGSHQDFWGEKCLCG